MTVKIPDELHPLPQKGLCMSQLPEREQCSTQPGMLGVPWLSGELVTCSCLGTSGGILMEALQIMAWVRLD